MNIIFEIEQLRNFVMLHSLDLNQRPGLFNGLMGIILAIINLPKYKDTPQYDIIADKLFECVQSKIIHMRDLSFNNGLSGIGWGVEYIIQHNYMDGYADDICTEIDTLILHENPLNIRHFDLETGLLGLWHYTIARIQGNLLAGMPLPFSKKHLTSWLQLIVTNERYFPANAEARLRSALSGELIFEELMVEPFIDTNAEFIFDNLSLRNGVAGRLINLCSQL